MDNVTVGQILSIGGTIMGIIALASYVITPVRKFSKRVEDLEEKRDKDFARLNALEDDNRMLLRSMKILIAHNLTGNETGSMKKISDELDEYIINRK